MASDPLHQLQEHQRLAQHQQAALAAVQALERERLGLAPVDLVQPAVADSAPAQADSAAE